MTTKNKKSSSLQKAVSITRPFRFSLALIVFVLAMHTVVAAQQHTSKHVPTPTQSTPKAKPVPATPKPAPAPPAAPTPAPAAPAAPKKAAPRTTVSSSAPVPVVTPAPQSSVNTLTPTTPAAASGGSTNTSTPPATTSSYSSTNWAGWLSTSGSFTSVSGSWIAPHATGIAGTTSADATWIGIGGVSSNDLIQVGTVNVIAADGTVDTSAFYELLPGASQTIPGVSVSPGDSLSASVSETSPGQWIISITDNTNGQTFTQSVAYASSHSSAEWIEEDPSYGRNRLIPLDRFGVATFTNGLATSGGITRNILGNQSVPITLVNNAGQALATTSALTAGGSSFSVTHN